MSTPIEITKSLLWNKANKFYVDFSPKSYPLPFMADDYNAAITTVEVPDVANENFEEYIAGKFYTAYGRNSIYQLNITFKDISPSSDYGESLYSYFNNYLVSSRKQYADDCKWTIIVYTKDGKNKTSKIVTIEDGLLVGVSGLNFDQSNDQILEFSCSWKFTLFNKEDALRTF